MGERMMGDECGVEEWKDDNHLSKYGGVEDV